LTALILTWGSGWASREYTPFVAAELDDYDREAQLEQHLHRKEIEGRVIEGLFCGGVEISYEKYRNYAT
jgi:hypothetical protein